MTDYLIPERERVTCYLCRLRRKPEAMNGTRCADRDDCLRAMGQRVTSPTLTGAERAAFLSMSRPR